MIANIAAQPGWTTTYEVPLRPDLRWAIETRLASRREQDRAPGALGGIDTAILSAIARGVGGTAYHARLERDLAAGTCLETVGDVELRPGLGEIRLGEVRVNGIVLRLDHQAEQDAAATLRAHDRLQGATVCYSPEARMLLEIVTADGVLMYRAPELLRPRSR